MKIWILTIITYDRETYGTTEFKTARPFTTSELARQYAENYITAFVPERTDEIEWDIEEGNNNCIVWVDEETAYQFSINHTAIDRAIELDYPRKFAIQN